jgi:hypothetical protein
VDWKKAKRLRMKRRVYFDDESMMIECAVYIERS